MQGPGAVSGGMNAPSRTGPFTLRMMRRFWSSRNLTRTWVTCAGVDLGVRRMQATQELPKASAASESVPGHGSQCGR